MDAAAAQLAIERVKAGKKDPVVLWLVNIVWPGLGKVVVRQAGLGILFGLPQWVCIGVTTLTLGFGGILGLVNWVFAGAVARPATSISRTVEGFSLGTSESAALALIRQRAARRELREVAEAHDGRPFVSPLAELFEHGWGRVLLRSTMFMTDSARKVELHFFRGSLFEILVVPTVSRSTLLGALTEKYGLPERPRKDEDVASKLGIVFGDEDMWSDGETRLLLSKPASDGFYYVRYEDIATLLAIGR